MPLEGGSRLGHYDVLALEGVGGMGEVYRAFDSLLNRDVALKVLPARLANDAHALALRCTLVTDNERDFARIRALPVENWLRDQT